MDDACDCPSGFDPDIGSVCAPELAPSSKTLGLTVSVVEASAASTSTGVSTGFETSTSVEPSSDSSELFSLAPSSCPCPSPSSPWATPNGAKYRDRTKGTKGTKGTKDHGAIEMFFCIFMCSTLV